MSWAVGLSSAAIRSLDQLPPRVVPAIIEFLYRPLAAKPHRVGKPLRDDFTGIHSAHRGGYRVLYEIKRGPPLGHRHAGGQPSRSVPTTLAIGPARR